MIIAKSINFFDADGGRIFLEPSSKKHTDVIYD